MTRPATPGVANCTACGKPGHPGQSCSEYARSLPRIPRSGISHHGDDRLHPFLEAQLFEGGEGDSDDPRTEQDAIYRSITT